MCRGLGQSLFDTSAPFVKQVSPYQYPPWESFGVRQRVPLQRRKRVLFKEDFNEGGGTYRRPFSPSAPKKHIVGSLSTAWTMIRIIYHWDGTEKSKRDKSLKTFHPLTISWPWHFNFHSHVVFVVHSKSCIIRAATMNSTHDVIRYDVTTGFLLHWWQIICYYINKDLFYYFLLEIKWLYLIYLNNKMSF